MRWMNEPRWSLEAQDVEAHGSAPHSLRVQTDDHTDFWRETHYGFVRDSGHFLHTDPLHEFSAQVRVEGQYRALYDQAGLMIRSGPETWVKAGVEFVGEQQVSAVVTREFSDWNVRPVGLPEHIDLKLTRRGNALSVQVRLPGHGWGLLRLAYYPLDLPAEVGVYACSPERAGFEVRFSAFQLGPPDAGPLY